MITGHLYNNKEIELIFSETKKGSTKYIPILAKIFNQEMACRWVNNKS